jgi:hypothetical protein
MFDRNSCRKYTLCRDTQYEGIFWIRRVAVAESLAGIKRLFEVAVTSVAARPLGVRGPLRGRDFMLDDMTFGADRDGH